MAVVELERSCASDLKCLLKRLRTRIEEARIHAGIGASAENSRAWIDIWGAVLDRCAQTELILSSIKD